MFSSVYQKIVMYLIYRLFTDTFTDSERIFMIQDITPHHLYNEFTPRSPQNGDLIFAFRDRKLLADLSANTCRFPLWENVSSQFPTTTSLIWLFTLDQTSCFLVMDADLDFPETYTFHSLQEIRGREPKHHIFAAMTAFHLYDWYRNNRFCGRCGTPVVPDPSHKERMLSCPQCGNTIYPKICPAIIVGVIDGERILLTKYAGRNNPNYALIAGFTEIGETAEETVMREVYEEVGVRVKNLRYYKTQPWGMASDLLIGYYAELDGDSSITLDRNELSTGLWMDRKDIIIEDEDFSLTREMIVRFAKTGRAVLN